MTKASIDKLAAGVTAGNDAAAAALESFQAQSQQKYANIEKQARETADAVHAAKLATGVAEKDRQKKVLDHATELGTNPDAASFALNAIADQYKNNNARAQKFADRVAYALDPTNITKNPFKYIAQLAFIDLNKEGQVSAERAAERARNQYVGLNNMTQEYNQTQLAIKQTATDQVIAADAKAAAFDLLRVAETTSIEALRSNADGLLKALNLRNNAFDVERARVSAENEQIRMRLAQEEAARSRELFGLQLSREKRAMAREAKLGELQQKEEAAELQQLEIINTAAKLRGVPLAFPSIDALKLAYKSPELKEKIDGLLQVGLADVYYKKQSPGEPTAITLGGSPVEAMKMVKGVGATVSAGQVPVMRLVEEQYKALASTKPPKNKQEVEAFEKALNENVLARAKSDIKNITKGTGNIYAPPPLASYMDDKSFVAGAPYIANVLFKTDKDLGKQTVDFVGVTSQIVNAVKDKKLTLAQADNELKFLAAKTMAVNNALRQYSATAGLPAMTSVNVEVSEWGPMVRMFTGNSNVIDLANDVARAKYLSSNLASTALLPSVKMQATKTMQGVK